MEQIELDNLNKEELFETLKGSCKARVDLHYYIGILLLCLVCVAILFMLGQYRLYGLEIIPFVEFLAIGCIMGLLVANNYRFRKRADSLNTPEQLLHTYEKTVQNNNNCWFALMILIICRFIISTDFNGRYAWLRLAILIILLAAGVYLYFKKELVSQRDKEILRELRELTGNK